ncbi:pyridoxamine 5'-phosphate oxidase family protein [Nocardia brasiliensis]|uniref:pyridoxamine 5'-phosphate oxidase family protein n=1 Tax=Nocardia brasiliensis TaxID=37326 RepID=UPI0024551A23|nr:pyridoxamine 5'-phosphate oxidase family protein [Nocardia brasiliensis]
MRQAAPRALTDRKQHVLELLAGPGHLWLATAAESLPHLVPLAFAYGEGDLLMVTKPGTRTVRSLRGASRARAALGDTRDVVLIDGTTTFFDPQAVIGQLGALLDTLPMGRRVPGSVGLRLRPDRIQAWQSMAEIGDRTLMAGGRWLV